MTYFKPEEFACKCGCGFIAMDDELIKDLDIIREVLKKPLIIDSGCRCEKRNKDMGGKKDSDHLAGKAVDVRVVNSHTRFIILNRALALGIDRIGIGSSFIHLGRNPENPQEVIWLY